MRIAIAALLISHLAFAQGPQGTSPAADQTAPAAKPAAAPAAAPAATPAPAKDAPVAAKTEPAKTDAAGANVTASLKEKDPYRVVTPIAFYAVAGVSVALLIFAIAMDAVAAGTRNSIAGLNTSQDVLNAQNAAVAQSNAANVGYVLGAIFGLGTAVLGRMTAWKD
jgi:pilus assembly protein CpaC